MDPLYPRSNTWLTDFSVDRELPPGLLFDNSTGAIYGFVEDCDESGKRHGSESPQSHHTCSGHSLILHITGSNKYGSVSTTLIMTLGINTPPAEGVTVCAVPVPATFLGVSPLLFRASIPLDTLFPLPSHFSSPSLYPAPRCHSQLTLSWSVNGVDQGVGGVESDNGNGGVESDNGNGGVSDNNGNGDVSDNDNRNNNTHNINLRFVTHYNAIYSGPLSFTLKTNTEVLFFLDNYKTPLLHSSPSSQVMTYKVTINLAYGHHRLELYSATSPDAYFAVFYSSFSLGFPEVLLHRGVLSQSPASPSFASVPAVAAFEGIPLDIPVETWFGSDSLYMSPYSETRGTASPFSLHDSAPVIGETVTRLVVTTVGGQRIVEANYNVEPPREGVVVSIRSGQETVLEKEVPSFASFTVA